ncbi:TonB-dependent receptor domain-containing protein [Phenylobacterium sp.]|uniref:TonB-dependent receptor domain-containing protein n=1 Tax=Phenylobacterium sp. TaxID=1871053 RepID=UPI003562B451
MLLATAALSVVAGQACAQASAPAAPDKAPPAKAPAKVAKPPAGKTVEGITVTGQSTQAYRSSIDRRSYGVANDLATTTGSISDALKNIPSVEVDVQGNVSLRGDQNVTIMIDGKPSGIFKGPGAAAALQAMPADQVERVEVITNPSAQYSPEGTAGIINLITKQSRKPGRSGSVRLNVGTGERGNFGVSGAYNSNKLTLSGDASIRFDAQDGTARDERTFLDGQGGELGSIRSTTKQVGAADFWNLRGSIDYDLTAKTRLSGEVRLSRSEAQVKPLQHFAAFGPTGAATLAFDSPQRFTDGRPNQAIQGSLRHKFGDDHDLVVNLSSDRTDDRREGAITEVFGLPVQPNLFTNLHTVITLIQTEGKADYTRPMPDGGKLKAGYDLRSDDNEYDNIGLRGVAEATAAPDPTQTNLFRYRQTVNAAYLTYEQPFGDWTVLGGLRLEDVRLDLDQVTSGIVRNTSRQDAYPSLHLAYKVSDDTQLTLSYSKRVQRPSPQDLNPFVSQRDQFTESAGNPGLKPQITNSFEAAGQYRANGAFYLATLYYRQNENGVTDVITPLANGVLLTTKENLSQSRAAGLELVANGKLTKTLSYNVSTNLYWNEIDGSGIPLGPGLGFGETRSTFAVGGRGSLTWQPTPKDMWQFNAQLNAKRLTPQGYTEPQFISFLGYRHKFNDSLSAVVTAQDLFASLRFRQIIDTPTLRDRAQFQPAIRSVFVGLAWTFGAAQKRPQTFDFGGGAPGP